ncbi:MAG TPA: helix-turn-helix transcriptional regulator [Steroidobacteraceae bacterium]|nr:helix-turn-helix transcriptional regulator [Steroidobacteraceae bacterium]
MTPYERRCEIGEFLRSRREALLPEGVGLIRGGRRRVRGLRREEVAELSGVSSSWYTWLEQGREVRPSLATLQRIAAALQFSHAESAYLGLLSGFRSDWRLRPIPSPQVCTIAGILDSFKGVPAVLYNRRFDVVAANVPARALYGQDIDSEGLWARNMLWRFFMDPERRRLYPDDSADRGVRNLIEVLRMNWVASEERDGIDELVEELRKYREFDVTWRERRVAMLATLPGRVQPRTCSEAIPVRYTRLAVHGDGHHVIEALIPVGNSAASSLERCLDNVA